MRSAALFLAAFPLVSAFNVVLSNDDGWAVSEVRSFYSALTSAGFDTILSAPAEGRSGTSSKDEPPTEVGDEGCQFDSCPPNSPATGRNASDPKLNVCRIP